MSTPWRRKLAIDATDPRVKVDQFGSRPGDLKVAAVDPLPASPGGGLRAVKGPALAPVLSWAPAARATGYDVLRCDASAGACVKAAYASLTAPAFTDASAAGASYWYEIAATNACGSRR